MKASQFLISTLKEAPADAEIVSHKLMMRAGLIKKLGAGLYNYMPMGLRSIRKVEAIIRDELTQAGCVELVMQILEEDGAAFSDTDREEVINDVMNEILGLGPLEPLLQVLWPRSLVAPMSRSRVRPVL